MSLAMGRNGGIYVPPFKLARMKQEVSDINSEESQRIEWEILRKSIKGIVNRVSISNLKECIQELFAENLVRGRGLFVRAVLHAQMASPLFTNVFASLVAVVNSKLPECGDLLLRRIVSQFRRAYMRSDEITLTALCKFVAHLFNQYVVSEMVVLQLVTILLEQLSSDSLKLTCLFLTECGEVLTRVSPKGVYLIFEQLRSIMQDESSVAGNKRVQYSLQNLFEARRNKFAANVGVPQDLDLVEESDRVTHEIDFIDGEVDGEEILNVFHPVDSAQFAAESNEWKIISDEFLGEVPSEGEDEEVAETVEAVAQPITDMSEQDLINLRRTIYLAIQSSANFEECVHKILSLNLRAGQEREVAQMLLDCCAMEKTSNRFYAYQAERLSRLSRVYRLLFESLFCEQYDSMFQYETGKIRNLGKFFGYLLFSDSLTWEVLKYIQLTEEDTCTSTRIFIKILFQDLSENMGTNNLVNRVEDPQFASPLAGLFPVEISPTAIPKIRFSINFFTAINLGALTNGLRTRLHEIQIEMANIKEKEEDKIRLKEEEDEERLIRRATFTDRQTERHADRRSREPSTERHSRDRSPADRSLAERRADHTERRPDRHTERRSPDEKRRTDRYTERRDREHNNRSARRRRSPSERQRSRSPREERSDRRRRSRSRSYRRR